MSVGELKKDIERLEDELIKNKKIINNLETYIKNKQLDLPPYLYSDKMILTKPTYKEQIEENSFDSCIDKIDNIETIETEFKSILSLRENNDFSQQMKENQNIELINQQLVKERELFLLLERKLQDTRVKYVDLITLNRDLEENIEELNQLLEEKTGDILLLKSSIEKKVNHNV